MNRGRLQYRASIARAGRSNVDGKTRATAPATVARDVHVWAEGIGPRQRAMVYGRSESARYVLSWMDDLFKHEDLVTLTKPALGTYVLRGIQYDIQGAYWIGTLEERTS